MSKVVLFVEDESVKGQLRDEFLIALVAASEKCLSTELWHIEGNVFSVCKKGDRDIFEVKTTYKRVEDILPVDIDVGKRPILKVEIVSHGVWIFGNKATMEMALDAADRLEAVAEVDVHVSITRTLRPVPVIPTVINCPGPDSPQRELPGSIHCPGPPSAPAPTRGSGMSIDNRHG